MTTINFYDSFIILYLRKRLRILLRCVILQSGEAEASTKEESSKDDAFGMLEILVGDGATGISVYTVGGGKVNDIDMSTGLVFALEQAIREHSGTAKDVFFGGINSSGGIGWCVKKFEVAGESREFYIGTALIPGCSYSLDIDTLEQKNKGKREFFAFLKDFLLPTIIKHLNISVEKLGESGGEATLDAMLRTGISAFKRVDVDQIVKSPDDLSDSWKTFSEACKEAGKEHGTILRALFVEKKGFVESKRVCSEMISEYLEELYMFQNVKLDEAERGVTRIFGPLKSGVDKSFDSWFRHVSLTAAESLFHINPSCLLLIGDEQSYLKMWDKVLKEKIREWGSKRKDFLVRMRYGRNFIDSVGAKFESLSRDEISEKYNEILDFLSVSMTDKIYEEFPLTALTYDFKKKTILKNEMLDVVQEVIPIVQQEVMVELFEKVKDDLFNIDKFTKDVFSRKKTETMRKKMNDWTNNLYKNLQERLYSENPVFSLFPEPIEQFRTKIADFINEKAIICLKDDVASAILLALKHLESEIKDPAAGVYLSFVKELVKGFVGKELKAIYPTLGYLLQEAKALDNLDEAFNLILKDTGYEDVKILENVSNEIKSVIETEAALKGSVEKTNEARLILQETIRTVLSGKEGIAGILLGDEL